VYANPTFISDSLFDDTHDLAWGIFVDKKAIAASGEKKGLAIFL